MATVAELERFRLIRKAAYAKAAANKVQVMTYAEAKASGYKAVDAAWARGYVSRKIKVDEQPVYEAGGRRKGLLYVDAPSWMSSQYHTRIYLSKEEA